MHWASHECFRLIIFGIANDLEPSHHRILVGISLFAVAIVLLLPGLTGFTSLDGTVNARFAIVNAPIDGEVAETPQKLVHACWRESRSP